MITENNFIKHIVEMKKSVDVWPEWKKNSLGGSEYRAKNIKVLSYEKVEKDIPNKK